MKQSTTLFPLSLALLLSTSPAFSSDSSGLLEEEIDPTGVAPTVVIQPVSIDPIDSTISNESSSTVSVPTAAEEVFDPRDTNHDGIVSIGEKVKGFFDRDGDGDIDLDDLKHAAKELLAKVKGIFDVDGDGQVEFDEILAGTQKALEHLDSLAGRVIELSGGIQGSNYFELIPENVRGPLTNLFAVVDEAAKKTQKGLNIGGDYVGKIEEALKGLKPNISNILKGDAPVEEVAQAKKDIFAYLEMIKGWYNTGENAKLITSIEKKLSKAEA